jgi:hypothetical protein
MRGLLLDLARVQDGDSTRDPLAFASRVAAALAACGRWAEIRLGSGSTPFEAAATPAHCGSDPAADGLLSTSTGNCRGHALRPALQLGASLSVRDDP